MLNFVFGFTVCYAISLTVAAAKFQENVQNQKDQIKSLSGDREYYLTRTGLLNDEVEKLQSAIRHYEKQLNLN